MAGLLGGYPGWDGWRGAAFAAAVGRMGLGGPGPPRQALAVARHHAIGEPLGGELARELRALQLDRRDNCASGRLPALALGELDHLTVELGTFEAATLALLQIAPDVRGLHPRLACDGTRRGLGLARRRVAGGCRTPQVAVE